MATRRDALPARREVLGFTQETLAHQLGVELSTIGRWERGTLTPRIAAPAAATARPRVTRCRG